MSARNRQSTTRRQNARPRHIARRDPVTQCKTCVPGRAKVANRREPGANRQKRIFDARDCGCFVAGHGLAPEGRAGIAGQMDMGIDEARHDSLVREVDHLGTGGCRRARFNAQDATVFDNNGRRTHRGLAGIDNQATGLNGVGFSLRRACGKQRGSNDCRAHHHEFPFFRRSLDRFVLPSSHHIHQR